MSEALDTGYFEKFASLGQYKIKPSLLLVPGGGGGAGRAVFGSQLHTTPQEPTMMACQETSKRAFGGKNCPHIFVANCSTGSRLLPLSSATEHTPPSRPVSHNLGDSTFGPSWRRVAQHQPDMSYAVPPLRHYGTEETSLDSRARILTEKG